jgi:hypothetical protein
MNSALKVIEKQIEEFYKSENIFNTPLQACCKFCNNCWKGLENRKRNISDLTDLEKSKIYKPYIGDKYNDFRLLIIGINMNNHGGYEEQRNIAIEACRLLSEEGMKKLNFGNQEYAGSVYWHRVASYAVVYTDNANITTKYWSNDSPPDESIAIAFDYFAITNSIKCAPKNLIKGDRSIPSTEMFNNCPSYILKKEIEILNPSKILVLGKENYSRVVKALSNNQIFNVEINNCISSVKINGINIVGIIHPTAKGGSKKDLFYELDDFAE